METSPDVTGDEMTAWTGEMAREMTLPRLAVSWAWGRTGRMTKDEPFVRF